SGVAVESQADTASGGLRRSRGTHGIRIPETSHSAARVRGGAAFSGRTEGGFGPRIGSLPTRRSVAQLAATNAPGCVVVSSGAVVGPSKSPRGEGGLLRRFALSPRDYFE